MGAPATPGVSVLTLVEARALVQAQAPAAGSLLADNTVVQRYIDAATGVVEGIAGPIVVAQRSFSWDGGPWSLALPWRILPQYDIVLLENLVALTVNVDFDVDAVNGMILGGHQPGRRWFMPGTNNISITAWTGREVVPATLKSAVAEEFKFLWRLGVQGPRPAFGVDQAAAAGDFVPTGFAIPHRVVELAQFDGGMPGFA